MRPFVLDELVLTEVADDENLDLNDRMAITKFLKTRVALTFRVQNVMGLMVYSTGERTY